LKKYYLTYLCTVIFINSTAQSWVPLLSGTDGAVVSLYADSVSNQLYVGGGHFQHAGNIPARGIARWNGSFWDSLSSGIDTHHPTGSPQNVLSITKYNDLIFVAGAFNSVGGLPSRSLAIWDGNNWHASPITINSTVVRLTVINNKLILCGNFTNINGNSNIAYAVYDSLNCQSPNLTIDSNFNNGNCVASYSNEIFFGGNFAYSLGYDFLRWDSNSVMNVGLGLQGGLTWINCMATYKNDLYIGGYFTLAGGNPADFIMKWDGNTLTEVGDGLNGQVWSMKVYNDELYLAGAFTQAGNISASHLVKWNGTDWLTISNSIFDDAIVDIEFLNGELYAAGNFTHIDNIPINYIAKFNGNLSTNENTIFSKIIFYPNPSKNKLQIESNSITIEKIKINNILGEEIYSISFLGTSCQLDISFLTNGLYFLIIETKEGRIVKKFIKE
jgi:hypothetical protein